MTKHPNCDNLDIVCEEAQSGWSRLETEEVFRQLVCDEIRSGRTSRSHRARLLSMAEELDLCKIEMAQHFDECREALRGRADRHAARIVGVVAIIALVVAAEMLLLWFFKSRIVALNPARPQPMRTSR